GHDRDHHEDDVLDGEGADLGEQALAHAGTGSRTARNARASSSLEARNASGAPTAASRPRARSAIRVPRRRASRTSCVTKRIVLPRRGRRSASRSFGAGVFPAPLRPRGTRRSPASTSREKSASRRDPPRSTVTPRKETSGGISAHYRRVPRRILHVDMDAFYA